jgi:tetratricopeptide (TPR) repeat protein
MDTMLTNTMGTLAQGGLDLAGGPSGGSGSFSTVALVVLGVALVVGVVLGIRWVRSNATGTSVPASGLNRDTKRRIDEAIERRDYETAGDLYARAGAQADAADCYVRAEAFIKAAAIFQASGNRAQAINCYKQAGDNQQAARLYAEDGNHRSAAAEYVQAKDFAAAAKHYKLAGDTRRAAENFERVGNHLDAARAYEEVDEPGKAAEAYERHLGSLSASEQEHLEGEDRDMARRVGELFKDAGEMGRAADVFRMAGFFREAADCLRVSGDYTAAAQMLLDANQPMLAAQILDEAGEEQRASRMRAEAAMAEGDEAAAADAFRKAGEAERAAELYEKLGKSALAAELYESVERYEEACELFAAIGKYGNAARCAEHAGKMSRAAALYEEAGDVDGQLRMLAALGDNFKAGRMLFELRRFGDALEVLERIDSRDPLYQRALELQGDVMRAQGRHEKAYSRYRAALGTREIDLATLSLVYKMGRALEEVQDFAGAMQNYALVQEVDPRYEDAALRLRSLRERQRRGKATTSGLFSSNDLSGEEKRYEILGEIARGGMGIVYKARDTVLGRVVAFKVLGENLRENETAVKYFLREARAAAALSHSNIVTIYDAGEQDGEFYMAMELVEGTTLKELIQRVGALPEDQVRYIIINCCRALQYAHSKGIIHRDIKSGNVMITRDKTLKVMDFGLAKFLREYQNNHTQQVGTPFYMSPEQIIGKDIDFRSDLYSLGCMAFECGTGTVPFFKGDLTYHHLHTKPPSPRALNPKLSKEIEGMILKMLAKTADERYQSAGDIIKALS